jgi:putative Mg2+ transporter-C (MgtC) family protein
VVSALLALAVLALVPRLVSVIERVAGPKKNDDTRER